MDINEVLHDIQQKLKAPKNQYNKFGGYNYRSCEDILEAVKKLLPKGVHLTLTDSLEECGGRVFIHACAKISETWTNTPDVAAYVSAHGYAEHAKEQKGMQPAQITGAASSYARKYALNGLFCIDDTKDNDTDENRIETKKKEGKVTEEQKKEAAAGFVDSAIATIEEMDNIDDVNKWMQENSKKLNALIKYEDLNDRFNQAHTALLDRINTGA